MPQQIKSASQGFLGRVGEGALSLIGQQKFSSVEISCSSNPIPALSAGPRGNLFNLPEVQFPQLQNRDNGKLPMSKSIMHAECLG